MSWSKIRHFTMNEFRCRCGCNSTGVEMDLGFVRILDELRHQMRIPLVVSSGYRCPKHPNELVKLSPGIHQLGRAADFAIFGGNAFKFLGLAFLQPAIVGIGDRQHGDIDGRFVHVDVGPAATNRPRPWKWSYE